MSLSSLLRRHFLDDSSRSCSLLSLNDTDNTFRIGKCKTRSKKEKKRQSDSLLERSEFPHSLLRREREKRKKTRFSLLSTARGRSPLLPARQLHGSSGPERLVDDCRVESRLRSGIRRGRGRGQRRRRARARRRLEDHSVVHPSDDLLLGLDHSHELERGTVAGLGCLFLFLFGGGGRRRRGR